MQKYQQKFFIEISPKKLVARAMGACYNDIRDIVKHLTIFQKLRELLTTSA